GQLFCFGGCASVVGSAIYLDGAYMRFFYPAGHKLALSVLLSISFLPVFAADTPTTLSPQLRGSIDQAAQQVLKTTGVPSASIAVVQDGKIAYVQAYGSARLDPQIAAT